VLFRLGLFCQFSTCTIELIRQVVRHRTPRTRALESLLFSVWVRFVNFAPIVSFGS